LSLIFLLITLLTTGVTANGAWHFVKIILYCLIPAIAVGVLYGAFSLFRMLAGLRFVHVFFIDPFFGRLPNGESDNLKKTMLVDLRYYYLYTTNKNCTRIVHTGAILSIVTYFSLDIYNATRPNLETFIFCLIFAYLLLISRYYILLRRIKTDSFCSIYSERISFLQFIIANKNNPIARELRCNGKSNTMWGNDV
jgi:hypothetical protein